MSSKLQREELDKSEALARCYQAAKFCKSKEKRGLVMRSNGNFPRIRVALCLVLEGSPFYQGLDGIAMKLNFWITELF